MIATHLEILVEEPSMEAFLQEILPRVVGDQVTFTIHPHQGKPHLLRKLADRLRGYSRWLPEDTRIFVLMDRDDDDCLGLKQKFRRDCGPVGPPTAATRRWSAASRSKSWKRGSSESGRAFRSLIRKFLPTSTCRPLIGALTRLGEAPGRRWRRF
jgi:hypothetical protein